MPTRRRPAAVLWAITCFTVGCHEFMDPNAGPVDVPPVPQILEVPPSFTAVGQPEAWVSVRSAGHRSETLTPAA
jgi:hypothetical protein